MICIFFSSLLGVKKRSGHAQVALLSGFNSKFPTSIPTPFICGVSPGLKTRHETLKYSPRYCWGGFTSNSWSQHLTSGYFNCNTVDIFSSYSNLCFLRGAMRTNTKLYTWTVPRCSLTMRHRRGRRRSPKNALCCLDRGRKGTGHGSSRVRLGATLSTRRDAERGRYTDSDSVMFHPVIDQTPETKVFCSISCPGSKPQPNSLRVTLFLIFFLLDFTLQF